MQTQKQTAHLHVPTMRSSHKDQGHTVWVGHHWVRILLSTQWCGILYQNSFTYSIIIIMPLLLQVAMLKEEWMSWSWSKLLYLNLTTIALSHKRTQPQTIANLSIHTTVFHDKKEPMKTSLCTRCFVLCLLSWSPVHVCMLWIVYACKW